MTISEPTRRERKKEETRDRIFKAAIHLFREKGFEATTIEEISEAADVAKGTFFNYFPKKEAVLAYLSEKQLELAEENAAAVLAAQRPNREKLLEIYSHAASAYEEDRELSRYVILEVMARAFQPYEELHHRWEAVIVRVIEQGQATGEVRRDVDAVRAQHTLGGIYMATVYTWLCCPEDSFPIQEEMRARLELVLDGMTARGVRP